MKNVIFISSTFMSTVLLTNIQSCDDVTRYGAGNTAGASSFIMKPIATDSTIVYADYVQGELQSDNYIANSDDDRSNSVSIGLGRSLSMKFISMGARVFGYGGDYRVSNQQELSETYRYYGAGFNAECYVNIIREHFELRPAGYSFGLAKEWGSYSNWRREVDNQPGIADVSPRSLVGQFGIHMEYVYKWNGFQMGVNIGFMRFKGAQVRDEPNPEISDDEYNEIEYTPVALQSPIFLSYDQFAMYVRSYNYFSTSQFGLSIAVGQKSKKLLPH